MNSLCQEKLGNLCEIELGKTPFRANKLFWDINKETNNVWLSIADLLTAQDRIISSSQEHISNEGAMLCKPVKAGTLLVSFKLTLGRMAFAGRELFTNEAIAALAIKNERRILKEYLYYFLSHFNWDKAADGDIKIKGKTLNKAKLKEINILFPDNLNEQQRIVDLLDKVFYAIDESKKIIDKNITNLKCALKLHMYAMFFMDKNNWQIKNLGDVCEKIGRGISPKYTDGEGACVLNQKCIRNHSINFELSRTHDIQSKRVTSDKLIQIGDVLVNSTGTGTLGRVAQVKDLLFDAVVDSHITIVRPLKNIFYLPFFGYAMILIEDIISTKGSGCGGQIELSRDTLKNDFKISYPESLIEQQRIVALLDKAAIKTKKIQSMYQKKRTCLDELKKSILQKAFRGELTEKDACLNIEELV